MRLKKPLVRHGRCCAASSVAKEPRLVHFVANTDDIQAGRAALKAVGIDRGAAVEASRPTRKGRLEWKITVRDDGQRLFNGALPSLIQWGKNSDAEPLRLHPETPCRALACRCKAWL